MKRVTCTPKGGTKVMAEAWARSLSARSFLKEVVDAGAHSCKDALDAAIQRMHAVWQGKAICYGEPA